MRGHSLQAAARAGWSKPSGADRAVGACSTLRCQSQCGPGLCQAQMYLSGDYAQRIASCERACTFGTPDSATMVHPQARQDSCPHPTAAALLPSGRPAQPSAAAWPLPTRLSVRRGGKWRYRHPGDQGHLLALLRLTLAGRLWRPAVTTSAWRCTQVVTARCC